MDIFKGNTVYLRLMEPQDYEKTYMWRNDYNMQKMTCGPLRFISKEMEKNWAQNRSLDNTRDIYLAICEIKNNKMIGYTSINDINPINRSCDIGGIVIGDNEYRDGSAFIEVFLLLLAYIFDQLNMHRTYGYYLRSHKMTSSCMEALFYVVEGCQRQAIYKDGVYHDMICAGMLRNEYYEHRNNGELEFAPTLKRLIKKIRKKNKNE